MCAFDRRSLLLSPLNLNLDTILNRIEILAFVIFFLDLSIKQKMNTSNTNRNQNNYQLIIFPPFFLFLRLLKQFPCKVDKFTYIFMVTRINLRLLFAYCLFISFGKYVILFRIWKLYRKMIENVIVFSSKCYTRFSSYHKSNHTGRVSLISYQLLVDSLAFFKQNWMQNR